jgi:hypothetical protein
MLIIFPNMIMINNGEGSLLPANSSAIYKHNYDVDAGASRPKHEHYRSGEGKKSFS